MLYAGICDLDHFKEINDTHGHQAGDAVLNEFVQVLGDNLRAYDRIGRYGGEEFLILTPLMGDNDPPELFERLRRRIEDHPFAFEDRQIRLTISIGVAHLRPDEDADQFLGRADAALYRAKHEGRNRVVY